MPKLNNLSEKDIITIRRKIFEDKETTLMERGLLITMLINHEKCYEEVKNEVPDKEEDVDVALADLMNDGYVKKDDLNGEEIFRVSDLPEFLEG